MLSDTKKVKKAPKPTPVKYHNHNRITALGGQITWGLNMFDANHAIMVGCCEIMLR